MNINKAGITLDFITKAVKDIIYSVDAESEEFLYLSPSFTKILGYTIEDITNMGGRLEFFKQIISITYQGKPGDFAQKDEIFEKMRHKILNDAPDIVRWWKCKDGSQVCLEDSSTPIYENGKMICTFGTLRDITDRKLAELHLKESEARYRIISENVADVIIVLNENNKIIYISHAYKNDGYNLDECIGKDFLSFVSPGDSEKVRDVISQVIAKHIFKTVEYSYKNKKGKWRFKEASVNSFLLEDGVTNIILVMRDVTDKKLQEKEAFELHEQLQKRNLELENALTELKQMQGYLVHEEKLASIGQLVAGIAHEINNPLAFVSSNLNRFNEYFCEFVELNKAWSKLGNVVENNEEYKKTVQNVRELELNADTKFLIEDFQTLMKHTQSGTERIRKIVEQLRGFTRLSDHTLGEASINDALEETLSIVWNEIKYKAEVKKEFVEIPRITCNIGELKQVFVNLLVNAAQSINANGKIYIRTSALNSQVKIEIEDNGSGIAPENVSKIFEPFFTTKEVGKGTGLGLWVTATIIQKHKGKINVESKLGKGTKFTILLPISRKS